MKHRRILLGSLLALAFVFLTPATIDSACGCCATTGCGANCCISGGSCDYICSCGSTGSSATCAIYAGGTLYMYEYDCPRIDG